ncbi:MFS transporter [Nonomuraea sp. MG754425]|uniref:MFS transporter n=1 Tax=Nonomuraea sp. MG754425 TaxID=2570319 RepID=UPI001EFFDA40|nr:MFS transporter [Nonomuraea sp. MG754425]MCF6472674.1 MFS transporter [Nonomuraea sp. MG754425]
MSSETAPARASSAPHLPHKWLRISGLLLVGLFIAYLDRSNLSVGIKNIGTDLGFSGEEFAATSSLALTAFLVGYLISNFLGGFLTARIDAKWILLVTVAGYSLCTLLIGFADSVGVLVALRVGVGIFEGIYWPQQFRMAKAWFDDREMSRASALIQYYGQYLALALGFFVLTPVEATFGWRPMFWALGAIGLIVVLPLYARFLPTAPGTTTAAAGPDGRGRAGRLSFAAFGGWRFVLLVFSYFTNGMLFWGITLFIPLIVPRFGFDPGMAGLMAAAPYLVSLVLTVPMMILADRTGRRALIAISGLVVGGVLLACVMLTDSHVTQFALICLGLGYFTASYTPNIWAIAVTDLPAHAVGPATGIINGFGAGGGGIVAGAIFGPLLAAAGTYALGLSVLGLIAILGGGALILYTRMRPTPA